MNIENERNIHTFIEFVSSLRVHEDEMRFERYLSIITSYVILNQLLIWQAYRSLISLTLTCKNCFIRMGWWLWKFRQIHEIISSVYQFYRYCKCTKHSWMYAHLGNSTCILCTVKLQYRRSSNNAVLVLDLVLLEAQIPGHLKFLLICEFKPLSPLLR